MGDTSTPQEKDRRSVIPNRYIHCLSPGLGPRPQMPPNAEVKACEEAVQMALAEVNKYLLISTYKMDFKRKEDSPMDSDVMAKLKPPLKPLKSPFHTSMRQHYQAPVVLNSLRNKTTRYGHADRRVARGPIPTVDGDMCRALEYTTPQYAQQFIDPSKRNA